MMALAIAQAVIALKGHALVAVGWGVGVVTFLLAMWLGGDEMFRRIEIGLVVSSLAAVVTFAIALQHPAALGRRARSGLDHGSDHRHAVRDLTRLAGRPQAGSGGERGRPALVASSWRSWATIILINAGKSTSGSQPNTFLALDGSPINRSTSAGRRNLGSWRT